MQSRVGRLVVEAHVPDEAARAVSFEDVVPGVPSERSRAEDDDLPR
jgi:hypothetical protein